MRMMSGSDNKTDNNDNNKDNNDNNNNNNKNNNDNNDNNNNNVDNNNNNDKKQRQDETQTKNQCLGQRSKQPSRKEMESVESLESLDLLGEMIVMKLQSVTDLKVEMEALEMEWKKERTENERSLATVRQHIAKKEEEEDKWNRDTLECLVELDTLADDHRRLLWGYFSSTTNKHDKNS